MEKSADEVKAFYDQFLTERMVQYRLGDNLRVNKAVEFIEQHVSRNDVVVDIGCGIGIATEAAAKVASGGRVFGFDIGAKNIWYAQKTVDLPNVSFAELDVLTKQAELGRVVGSKVDVFILSDVIEHFPAQTRARIFGIMALLGSPKMKILLTYPTPAYQDYLRSNNPDELQVIDENVELTQLIEEATPAGLAVTYYALKDVWRPGQYVHCVLERSEVKAAAIATRLPDPKKPTLIGRFLRSVRKRYLKKRYVRDVFGASEE